MDPDPEADELPKFNQFFLVHRYICGKNFREDLISSFYVKLLTNSQTDKQSDKRRALHNLLGVGNNQRNVNQPFIQLVCVCSMSLACRQRQT